MMLYLSETYKTQIRLIGGDPQVFPLSTSGGWGAGFSFNSDFANMSFKDVTMTVLTMDKQVLTNYVVESPEGSKIINITDGATNTLITSLASTKLSSNQGKTSSAVTSARATQLWNETDGSSEATIINANPHFKTLSSSQHHVQALIQKYGIKVERSYTNLSTSITKGELEIISNLGTTLTIIEED